MYIAFFALLGLLAGSFLNVCIDRLPGGKSVVFPPSHCDSCNHRLGLCDLVPVFSYLFLRGRCRYCRKRIPLRLPVVEAVAGAMFGFFFLEFGFTFELAVFIIYGCFMILIFVIDLEHQLVLNRVVYPGMIIAFTFSFFRPEIAGVDSLGSGAVFQAVSSVAGDGAGRAVIALAGGTLGLAAMSVPYIIYPGGMGMGDIKLAAMAGMMTGYPLVILAMLMSWILGGVVAALLLALKIKGRKDAIPAAVFMTVSVMVTILWGRDIWLWYF